MKKTPEIFFLIGILFLGAILRFNAVRGASNELAGNEQDYYRPGMRLAQEWTYSDPDGKPLAFRGIYYPSFLAGLTTMLPPITPLKARRAMAALSWGSILIAWQAARLIHPAAGLVAALLTAVNPALTQASISLDVGSFLAFFIFPLLAWRLMVWERTWRGIGWVGFATASGILCRSLLVLFPFFFWVIFRYKLKKKNWLLFLALCFLPLIPWTLRNWRHFQEFLPLERRTGVVNFYDGARGLLHPPLMEESYRHAESIMPSIGNLPDDQRREAMFFMALDHIRRAPVDYFIFCLLRLWEAVKMTARQSGLIFFLMALLVWRPRKEERVLSLGVLAAYSLAAHCIITVQPRYLLPVVPVILILAAITAVRFLERSQKIKIFFAGFSSESPGGALWLRGANGALVAMFALSSLFCLTDVLLGGWRPKEISFFPPCRNGVKKMSDISVSRYLKRNPEEALGAAREAVRADPGCLEALLNLGAFLNLSGRPAEALPHYNKAISLFPHNLSHFIQADALSGRAQAFLEMNDLVSAVKDLEESLRRAPRDWKRRAEVYQTLRQIKKSKAWKQSEH